jgi:hypothetical protein
MQMRISLLCVSFFFVHLAFGQDSYYKSSIVTLNNDTVHGFISNIYDAKTIKFKKKKTDKPTIYTPKLLRGFILDGNVFETKAINVPFYKTANVSLTDFEKHTVIDKERGRLRDTVFLQKLIYGTVSLFKMTNKDGYVYYFAQKAGVLRDLPPRYAEFVVDSASKAALLNWQNNRFRGNNHLVTYIYTKDDYLDTLGLLLNDRRFITEPAKAFKYSQKSLSNYVVRYNLNKGIANGGLLKSKIDRKIFTGISAGIVALQYDDLITDNKINSSLAFKLYGLYPLSGVNSHVFGKFGLNYFSYQNDYYKKSIPSASFGLRYGTTDGLIRPYFEGSIAVATMNKDNRPFDYGFPFIAEFGVNVPVSHVFLTVGASYTPVMLYKLNTYKFWAFNVGLMF